MSRLRNPKKSSRKDRLREFLDLKDAELSILRIAVQEMLEILDGDRWWRPGLKVKLIAWVRRHRPNLDGSLVSARGFIAEQRAFGVRIARDVIEQVRVKYESNPDAGDLVATLRNLEQALGEIAERIASGSMGGDA